MCVSLMSARACALSTTQGARQSSLVWEVCVAMARLGERWVSRFRLAESKTTRTLSTHRNVSPNQYASRQGLLDREVALEERRGGAATTRGQNATRQYGLHRE
jgi:hypothetical protein